MVSAIADTKHKHNACTSGQRCTFLAAAVRTYYGWYACHLLFDVLNLVHTLGAVHVRINVGTTHRPLSKNLGDAHSHEYTATET